MSTARPGPGPTPLAAPSRRAQLARLAREAALATVGVAGASAGPQGRFATGDRGEVLAGVLATARRDAAFDLELNLIVSWPAPPLHSLAEAVRERVVTAAGRAGLGDVLGPIGISFADVLEPAGLGGPGP